MQTIIIPYKPREAFKPFHQSTKRWNVLVCHRAAGKSVALVNHFIRAACKTKKSVFSLVSPTYTQGKRTLWPLLHEYAGVIPGVTFNEAELLVTFPNGARLYLLGSENPDALRGLHQHGCGLDEYQHHPQTLFGEIIMPTLTTHDGFAVFAGTVKGKANLWQLWNVKQDEPDWFALYLRASKSGILSEGQLAAARANMTQEQYDQEYELEPLAYLEGAIFGEEMRWLRTNGRILRLEPSEGALVDTFWDLGVADYTVVWFVERAGGKARVLDCYATHNKALKDIALKIKGMPFEYGTHYLPHDAKKRTDITLETREDFLASRLPGTVEVVQRPANKLHAIDAFRWAHKFLSFDERMEVALSALEQYQRKFDEKKNVFLEEPHHTWESHYADGIMLLGQVMREEYLTRVEAPKQNLIRRQEEDLQPHYQDDGGFNV